MQSALIHLPAHLATRRLMRQAISRNQSQSALIHLPAHLATRRLCRSRRLVPRAVLGGRGGRYTSLGLEDEHAGAIAGGRSRTAHDGACAREGGGRFVNV
jgi:hypothetical protein